MSRCVWVLSRSMVELGGSAPARPRAISSAVAGRSRRNAGRGTVPGGRPAARRTRRSPDLRTGWRKSRPRRPASNGSPWQSPGPVDIASPPADIASAYFEHRSDSPLSPMVRCTWLLSERGRSVQCRRPIRHWPIAVPDQPARKAVRHPGCGRVPCPASAAPPYPRRHRSGTLPPGCRRGTGTRPSLRGNYRPPPPR